MTSPEALKAINDFPSFVAYLRDELEWEIPEELPLEQLTYSYTADELGLKLDAQVEITQLRPILGQQNPWGVFFVDFDKAELPVTLLRRILSSVSRRKRESANAGDRALFDKNDLLFVSAFGKADERRLALAHFHQEPSASALPTLRLLEWDRHDNSRGLETVAERLARLRWPQPSELPEVWKARWSGAFMDRPREAIRTSKEMAAALATCAKQIRQAIQEILPRERPEQPLSLLFEAVKATLNKELDVSKFADTYAQTIAYGLLSKRIDQIQRWRAEKKRTLNGDLPLPMITVDALEAAIPTNPFLSELLSSFLAAGGRDQTGAKLDFDELGLGDVVDLLNTANMEAVLDDFDKDKQGDDPVIHFYEGFLAAYDRAMKVQRGVFYTPKAVVSFIVRSVDDVLRTEFGLPLGLADTSTWGQFVQTHPGAKIPNGASADDPFVKILDPATGTGTFLVEVIDLIHRRMMDEAWKGKLPAEKAVLWNTYVAEHLLPRLYGYELMMAPYAVAHMKIGLKLAETGYDFSGTEIGSDGEARSTRARVFLTNALEPARDLDMQLAFMNEALAHEAAAANDAKVCTCYTAVLGNPPYSLRSGNMTPALRALVEKYKFVGGERIKERGALQFEKNIQDDYVKFFAMGEDLILTSGVGVLSYISNHAFVDNTTFRGFRSHLTESFPLIRVTDLLGNAKRGLSSEDQNVFDIQQGVAVFQGSRSTDATSPGRVECAQVAGPREAKYQVLSQTPSTIRYTRVSPRRPAYLFKPADDRPEEYDSYPRYDEIFRAFSAGVITARDAFAIDMDRQKLTQRISAFARHDGDDASLAAAFGIQDKKGWGLGSSQRAVQRLPDPDRYVRRIQYRPFDPRSIFYHDQVVWGCAAPVFSNAEIPGNVFLLTTRKVEVGEFAHVFVANGLAECHSVSLKEVNYAAPLLERASPSSDVRANLHKRVVARIEALVELRFSESISTQAIEDRVGKRDLIKTFGPRDVFSWIYATLHSPTYRRRYADVLKSDFPRVPLPKDHSVFAALGALGTRLVALHQLDNDAMPELFTDPKVRFVSNGGELRLGRFNKEVRRDASGRVYLNDQSWFATVPQSAWDHWIGGYQPAQKWLKDRSETGSKDKLKPGRLLTDEDILHYRRMIVALEETGKIMAEIDEVIARHGGWPDAFRGMEA